MNGFISRIAVAACFAVGLSSLTGCCGYNDVVDPCYPTRYNFAARKEVCEARYQQVHNGHILDQTVWNWHWKPGTEELNEAGRDHLIYLLRRRPCPDQCIYLATAEDINVCPANSHADLSYEPEHPERYVEARADLDSRRIVAIQKYLTAQTAGRGLAFHVVVHDPSEANFPAPPLGGVQLPVQSSIPLRNASFLGALPPGRAQ
jgi:hypothetical protein